MPSPSSALTSLRPDLAGSFMEFDLAMQTQDFIGTQVLPMINAAKPTGVFGKIPIEQLLQSGNTVRAPGGGYNRGHFTFTTDSYACIEHGWEEPVDDNEAAMYSEMFDAEQIATMRAFGFVLRAAEERVADAVFNTTTWTATTLANEWDDATNGVPITDVEAAVQRVYVATGIWPDTLIISRQVFRNLRVNTQVVDRIAAAGAGFANRAQDVTIEQLRAVFDLPKILIGGGTKNSANEGQTATVANIWSNEYAMICKTADSSDIREPCLGRSIHWDEDGSDINGVVETYRDEPKRSDIFRVRHQVDEKILYTALGELLDNVTT